MFGSSTLSTSLVRAWPSCLVFVAALLPAVLLVIGVAVLNPKLHWESCSWLASPHHPAVPVPAA